MKKVILIALFMGLLATVKSQVSMSVPVGISTLKTPVIGANVNLRISGFIVGAGFDSHISRKVKNGDLFYTRIGGVFNLTELNTLELTAGAGQYRRSADIKNLNEGIILMNATYVHQIESRPEGAIFVSLTATQKFTMITGGLRFIFRGREKYGCPSANVR